MIDIVNGLRRIAEEGYRFAGDAADEIERLRASLKAAEKDVALKERIIDSLGSTLNAMTNERDALRTENAALVEDMNLLRNNNMTLRAKVEAMVRQEPVAWMHETRRDSDVVTDAVKHVWGKVAVGSMAAYSIPLYALPGAQTQGE